MQNQILEFNRVRERILMASGFGVVFITSTSLLNENMPSCLLILFLSIAAFNILSIFYLVITSVIEKLSRGVDSDELLSLLNDEKTSEKDFLKLEIACNLEAFKENKNVLKIHQNKLAAAIIIQVLTIFTLTVILILNQYVV